MAVVDLGRPNAPSRGLPRLLGCDLAARPYPLASWHAFIIGVFLGHPITAVFFRSGMHGTSTTLWARLVASDLFIVIAIIGFGLSCARREVRWPRYTLPFLAFQLSCLLSLCFSPFRFVPGAWTMGLGEIIISFYLFVFSVVLYNFLLDRRAQSAAVQGVILGVLSSLLLAYSIKFLHFPNVPQHCSHLQGTFLNGSQMGHYLFLVAFMVFPLWFFGPADLKKKSMFLVILLTSVSSVLASKRAGIAAYAMLIALMIFYRGIVRQQIGKAMITLAAGIAGFASLYYVVFTCALNPEESAYYVARMEVLFDPAKRTNDFVEHNLQTALDFFMENPLTGIGYGLEILGPTEHEIHNAYLKFLGAGGALMVLGGVWFLIAAGLKGLHRPRFASLNQLTLSRCYQLAYLSIFVVNYWEYSIRKREMWYAIAFVEALKVVSSRTPDHAKDQDGQIDEVDAHADDASRPAWPRAPAWKRPRPLLPLRPISPSRKGTS